MSLSVELITKLSGHKSSSYALCTYDEDHFLSTGGDGLIIKWKANNWDKATLLAKVPTQSYCIYYDATLNVVYAGNMNGGLHMIDLNDKDNNQDIQIHSKGVFAITTKGNYLYTVGGDGDLRIFNKATLAPIKTISLSTKSLRSLLFTNQDTIIRIGGSDGNIYSLSVDSLEVIYTQKAHENSVFSLASTTKYILSGSRDAHLNAWDISTNSLVSSQPAHLFTINDIAILPKLNIFATASRDKSIRFWQTHDFKLKKSIDPTKGGHINSVNGLLWLSKYKLLISCSDDRSRGIWKVDKK